jgi:hypothetical protein
MFSKFEHMRGPSLGELTRIIHESPDTEGLICYKHVVKTVFEAEKEAFA